MNEVDNGVVETTHFVKVVDFGVDLEKHFVNTLPVPV